MRWLKIPDGWRSVRLAALLIMRLATVGRAEPPAVEATNFWSFNYCWPQAPAFRNTGTAAPAVARDGTIYAGTFKGKLFALAPDGRLNWMFQAGREIHSSPAIGTDGTIYFGARDGKFYAVTPDGKSKWVFRTAAWVDSSPAIGKDGTIYFGSWDKNFYALNSDGTLKWKFATGALVDSSPAIAADGTIYFGSHDKKFYALAPDGRRRWTFLTGGEISASPAIGADGTIYINSHDGQLYALNPDGTVRWSLPVGSVGDASPIVDEAGQVWLASGHTKIIAGAARPDWEWASETERALTTAVASGQAYVIGYGRKFNALNAAGQIVWTFSLEKELTSAPVVANNGTIYASREESLYAIYPPHPARAAGSWPMFRGNAQHTGRMDD